MMSEPIPDCPVIFGYKQIWLAVWDTAPQVVADAIGLIDTRTSTWQEGIERSYEQGYDREQRQFRERQEIFVSPPVISWILAVGGIGALPNPCVPEWLPWLRNLSALLGHVQSFGTHRVSSAAYWAKAQDGRIIRAYGYVDGRTHVNEGDLTPEEIALGFDVLDERRATPAEAAAHQAKIDAEIARWEALRAEVETLRSEAAARGEEFDEGILEGERFDSRLNLLVPDEDSVMMLAGCWSLDPMRLQEYGIGAGLGLIGSLRKRQI
jgi:hypothetical protein